MEVGEIIDKVELTAEVYGRKFRRAVSTKTKFDVHLYHAKNELRNENDAEFYTNGPEYIKRIK